MPPTATSAEPPIPPLPAADVSRETLGRIRTYISLLQRWNKKINLVAAAPESELIHRHFDDSLQLLPLLPAGPGVLVDLGSGGGFPGLVLAAATLWPTHLVEADKRKAAFLAEVARTLALPAVTVHASRIDAAAPALPPASVLTARALAPLTALLPLAHRLLAPGGIALFPKGRGAEAEIAEATPAWSFRLERFASRTDPAARILRISEIEPRGVPA